MKSIYDLRNLEKHEDLSACMLRKLPEEFIREFQDKVVWDDISKYQK